MVYHLGIANDLIWSLTNRMVISLILVQMWADQLRRLPPDSLEGYPAEAVIAWRMVCR